MEIEPISCLDVLPEEDYSEDCDEAAAIVREDILYPPKRLEELNVEAEEIILRKEKKEGVLSITLFFKLKSLGAISVKLTKEIGRLDCYLECENPSALSVLKENLPLLSAMLGVAEIDFGLAKGISTKFKRVDLEV